MQKIIPHFWFNTEAKEATAFYVSLFPQSQIESVSTITDTPSGDCDMVSFTLCNQTYMAISAGPYFKHTPAISLFVTFGNEAEVDRVWNSLVTEGKVLMALDTYPWSKKYGWVEDRFGVSWQLSLGEGEVALSIAPLLMFTGPSAGKAAEAIEVYTGIFPDATKGIVVPYTKEDADTEGLIKHATFTLAGRQFMAMDSSFDHGFTFSEAISFIIECDTQDEIDHYSNALSAHPESEQCGWIKDQFGLSWQVTPACMARMMQSGDGEATARVTQAFLPMKRFDIATLEAAFRGSD